MTRPPFPNSLRAAAAAAVTLVLATTAACKSDKTTGLKDGTTVRLNANDPQRDTLVNSDLSFSEAMDIRQTTVRTKRDTVLFVIRFMRPVAPASDASDASVGGYVDIDTDQNASTGDDATSDLFGGSSGIGVDYYVDLFDADAVEAPVFVIDADLNSVFTGYAPVLFDADSVLVWVPRDALDGDEGNFDFTVTAAVDNPNAPSDIAPNTGRYRVGGSGIATVGTRANRAAGSARGALGVGDARALSALGSRRWKHR